MNDTELRSLIKKVLIEIGETLPENSNEFIKAEIPDGTTTKIDENIKDITAVDLRKDFHVNNPKNKEDYLRLKEVTPARLGVGRAGPRFKTETLLRFRADHAAAKDAVIRAVSKETIDDIGLFTIQTKVMDIDQHITRPDLGRIINEEGIKILKENCKNPKVQIYLSDGLSSTSIETNAKDTLLAIMQGLDGYNIKYGPPFFLKYGRVGAGDHIGEIVGAEVVVLLIGERPGLVTSESMSSYITYKPYVGIPEAKRTVISNIHSQGTNPSEAGAHIADIIKEILEKKASGLDLKLQEEDNEGR